MSVHTGFEVLILLLDLSKALIQLHIFIFLGRQNQIGMRTVEDNSYFHPHLTSYYQLFQFHQFLLLLVKLFVSNIQNHLKAVQLLLQVQSVRVSLLEKARDGSSAFELLTHRRFTWQRLLRYSFGDKAKEEYLTFFSRLPPVLLCS